MSLYVTPVGRVLLVSPVVPINKDRVPSRREVEQALAVLRERLGAECGRELDTIHAHFTNRRNHAPF